MRIIAGSRRGHKLTAPAGPSRPTLEKVRGAIFNVLQHCIDDAVVLDLFCGSGALGLEAVSRGARRVTFVDCKTAAVRDNIRRLRVVNALVLAGDVFRRVRGLEHGAYDLVFMDPPYNRALVNRAVVSVLDLVSKSGIIAVEHHKKEVLAIPAGFSLLKVKDYGDTRVSFLKRT